MPERTFAWNASLGTANGIAGVLVDPLPGLMPRTKVLHRMRNGEWLDSEKVFAVVNKLCKVDRDVLYRRADALVHYLGCGEGSWDADRHRITRDLVVLVCDDVGKHFSLVLVDHAKKLAVVIDTLNRLSNNAASARVKEIFPRLACKLTVQNATGRVLQKGATCGAWCVWLAAAFLLNVRGCRDGSRLDVSAMGEGEDPVRFWRGVTRT
jgi:hypothetical protein